MAQVKKFQNGGGGLYLDGKQLTDEQINAAMSTLSAEDKYTWSKSIERARSGERVELNELANSVTGGDFSHVLNERQLEKNTSGNLNRRQRNRHARRGSDIDATNRGIANGISALKAQLNVKPEDPEKTKLHRGSDADGFYTKDEKGNYIYQEGPQNLTNESRINAVFDALQNGDLSQYDLTEWDSQEDLNGLTNWWASKGTSFNRDDFFTRLRGNNLDETDWEVLQAMGFTRATTPTTSGPRTHSDEGWTGNTDRAKEHGVYFTKDSNGNWFINSNEESNQYLGTNWYGGGLDFLTGTQWADGFIGEDGRLYTRQQVLGGDYKNNKIASFLAAGDSKGWRNWYDAANASGVRFSGDRTSGGYSSDQYGVFGTQFNPYTAYNENWSDYFSKLGDGDENYDIADLSNTYSNLEGRQVLAYVDPAGARDAVGIRGVKYVVRNADGTYTQYDSEDALHTGTGLTRKDQWWGVSPAEFNANPWETVDGNKYSLEQEIITKGNQQNLIMRGADGNLYLGRKDPSGKHLTPQLIRDHDLLKQILANPEAYDNEALENMILGKTPHPLDVRNRIRRWFGLPSNKNGGTLPQIKPLPKFQYGGNLAQSKTVKKEDSTEGKRTDITTTHALKGEGGLTKAEKMQIAAAIGDLAGVGLSFGKGTTSWLGAGLGLASTGTRFIADVKKDGFQGKDLGSALAGAALDVVSVVSTSSAIAKAVKTLKAAAEPIIKVLALAGAANGVSAMGKVVRGEKVTSEDLTSIISGLGSSVIVGKNLKDRIGKGKLSQQIESTVLKKQNADLDKEIGTTLKKKAKDVEKLITDANGSQQKAIDEVKKLLKAKTPDSEPTTADAKKVLEEWGVSFDGRSRFSGKSGEKWYQRINPFKKGEKQVSFTAPIQQEGHSLLRHMYDPRLRAQQLGYDAGYFGQKSGNLGLIDDIQLSDAIKAVKTGKATLAQQELVKLSAQNPEAFGFTLSKRVDDFNSGWGWAIPGRRPVPHKNRARLAEFIGPDGKPIVFRSLEAPVQGPIQDLTPIPTRELIGIGFDGKPIYAEPKTDVPGSRAALVKQWSDLYRFGVEGYKKGGKIIKGQSGLNPNWHYSQYLQTQPTNLVELPTELSQPTPKKASVTKQSSIPSLPTLDPVNDFEFDYSGISESNESFKPMQQTYSSVPGMDKAYNDLWGDYDANITAETDKIANETMSGIIGSLKPKGTPQGNPIGETSKRNLPWEALPALGSIAANRAIATNAGKKQLALAKDSYNSVLRNLEQNPIEHYNRYSEAGIDQATDDAAINLQTQAGKARYADASLNEAVRMGAAGQVSNLMLQKGQQKSQMFQNWLNQDNELRRNYALQRTAVENRNRQRIAQADAYLNQQKGAAIAQQSAIDQGALGDIKSVMQIPQKAKLQQEYMTSQNAFNDDLRNWKTQWQTGLDNKSIAAGTTFDDWIVSNPTLMQQFRNHQNTTADLLARQQYFSFAKGGTIKHRPEKEQIRINQQKIVADAIKQLSKQAFEFLKMALS